MNTHGTNGPLPVSTYRTLALPQGELRYSEIGPPDKPVLLFIHGLLVNSQLWRHVIPALARDFRCIAPDLPLGAHSIPLAADAERGPRAVAKTIEALMTGLDLRDVTLVGNDTGGALCQIVMAHHGERIARVVLTNCDAFEAFLPWAINWFATESRRFGQPFVDFIARVMRYRIWQRVLLFAVSKRRYSNAELDAYLQPFQHDTRIRADLTAFLIDVRPAHTQEAARHFAHFTRPVHLLWSTADPFFRPSFARRLQRALPNCTLNFINGSRAFVPEDQPELLLQHIREQVLPISMHNRGHETAARSASSQST